MATTAKTSSKTAVPKTSKRKTKVPAPVVDSVTEVDTSNTPRANTATPSVVDTLSPVVMSNDLRKKELFELVVERSGMKKKDVKPVVEAMLAVLGDAFGEQREMNLPPLGKLKVQRGKELPDGRALVVKLRQKTSQLNAAPKPEGDAAEE
ncbi:HU family DNA-binding protein [Sulfitobacter donghicola]|uniref:DNA-binding protein n=1 Tax=Sulfitobacter donghicola DSW-25 = KCTC 12864 = JCM 14565 TaxID=1300350 RepID=A0A073IL27_9RHOB|nr:HU family DNA-binding protein [Sulfitobacter donghicola]KEJ90295.1 DNA-binding protein [Sulfitobacter donghicola DSW-25 = KCTC 12864 = JCM 14565]